MNWGKNQVNMYLGYDISQSLSFFFPLLFSVQAKKIVVHQKYVWHERDQFDIALIETDRLFDFSNKEKISPICLPSKMNGLTRKSLVL